MTWRQAPGLRVLARFGGWRLASIFALMVLGQALAIVLFWWRADLLHPGDLGSDASNYYAAAQRLLNGSPLYALSPGDRPVPADNPPLWSVPLLSPPPIAVLWMPLALLVPGAAAMTAWWLVGLVGAAATGMAAAARGVIWASMGVVILAIPVAVTAVSGNVNAWLLPVFAIVFALEERPQTPRVVATIAILASLAAAVKLAPVLLLWWLATRGRWRAAAFGTLLLGIIVAVSVLVAGLQAFVDYVDISRSTASAGATGLSSTGLLAAIGAPPAVASTAPIVCFVTAGLALLLLRGHRTAGTVVVTLGAIYATPVVRFESFALVIPALAATLPRGEWLLPVPPRLARAATLGVGALGGVALMAWTAGAPRSAVALENRTQATIIVRFGTAFQAATFGFRVPPGASVTAYRQIPGGLAGDLVVYDLACDRLAAMQAPPLGGSIVVGGASAPLVTVADFVDAGEPAPFDSTCAGR